MISPGPGPGPGPGDAEGSKKQVFLETVAKKHIEARSRRERQGAARSRQEPSSG